jgi:branched-subunit amino acid aminotransferase/4-amino-4-deoxychorismate lyase
MVRRGTAPGPRVLTCVAMATPLHPTSDDGPRQPRVPRAIAWMDGRVVPADQATVPLLDDGFVRGDAVFDAMLVRSGRTHARDRHLARLRRSARNLGIRVPVLTKVVDDLLLAWGDHDGALKVIVTRTGLLRGLLSPVSWPETIALSAVETHWRGPLTGTKTLSYAANQWATRQARAAEGDDALVVDDGLVCEVPTAAVVVVHGDRLRTPDPDRVPILASVSIEVLREVVDIEPAVLSLDEVREADELWVASATRPLLPVHALDDVAFEAPGPIAQRVGPALEEHIAATLD